jgi:hypothetical protein
MRILERWFKAERLIILEKKMEELTQWIKKKSSFIFPVRRWAAPV